MGLLPMDIEILPPSDDRIFKLLMTSPEGKPVLIDLISATLRRSVVDVVVRNNELPPGDTDEKAERLDVNCKIDDGTQVDLEMQASRIQEDSDGKHKNLKGKSIYYLCDLHSSQSSKGLRRYDKLAQTYQVTFCSYTVFPNLPDYVNSFSMRHNANNELLSDAIHVIYVELSKLGGIIKKSVDDMTDLEKWALFLHYANIPEYRETVNRVIQSKEALQMAGSLLMSVSKDERERAVFRSRRMYETDMQSNLATAEDRGRKEGWRDGALAVAQNMIAEGESVEKITKYTGLTREEVEKLDV
ncbi:MAG: Rpn family recombination-promoting nuclease/putative transposase [Synergistaceae bacterium]|jgi:predicted transposase/invertase (TIGR01784 family)|nr:Rpn family recombination-promoting nuclease/putative transposase [Synergistaceae bacterium]